MRRLDSVHHMYTKRSTSERPHILSWRASDAERALVYALAAEERRTVSDTVRDIVVSEVRRRLAQPRD